MNNEQFAPFYVGQEVVCISSPKNGGPTIGRNYTITGIFKSFCKCAGWDVTIGEHVPWDYATQDCGVCGVIVEINGPEFKYASHRFRAITPAMEAVTFEKITEQHPVSVN